LLCARVRASSLVPVNVMCMCVCGNVCICMRVCHTMSPLAAAAVNTLCPPALCSDCARARPAAEALLRTVPFEDPFGKTPPTYSSPLPRAGSAARNQQRSRGISCLSDTDSVHNSPLAAAPVSPPAAGMLSTDPLKLPDPNTPHSEESSPMVRQAVPFRRAASRRLVDAKVSITDFEVLRVIGKGAYSVVCVARHRPLNRCFALKRTKKSSIANRPKVVQYLEAERWCLHSCRSPFIVKYCGSLQDAKHVYFVMEYCEGGELFNLLCAVGAFQEEMAKFYVAEVIVALEAVHAAGIVYRDLKPENIMLDRFGHVKLVDFGFAVEVPPGGLHTRVGTAHYVAPEMLDPACLAAGYGREVDVWALGCLIFELISGRAAFGRNDEPSRVVFEGVLKGRVSYPSSIPPVARSLIQALLERNITKRITKLADVKAHAWFADIDWVAVAEHRMRAPIEPAQDGGEANVLQGLSLTDDADEEAAAEDDEDEDEDKSDAFHAF
jgi:protein kinase A